MPELITQLSTGGRRTKFTPEKVQQIKNLVERGQSREEIAEVIGMTVGSLQVTCSRLGISLRRPIFDTGTGLLRRGRPRSNNGKAMHNPSRSGRAPLQPTKEQPQQNSQSGPVEQAQAATPHQDRSRTNEAGLAKFAIKMQYRREERTTELPLTQDMIIQLAFAAEFRDMSIGELVGQLIIAMMKKDDLFQQLLEPDRTRTAKQPPMPSCTNGSAATMPPGVNGAMD
jgi:hypothetical protein